MKWIKALRRPVMVSLVLLVVCGFLYPVALTGISMLVLPAQANGSLVYADGAAVGARFVGQDFTDPRFMRGRPSAVNYNTYTAEAKEQGDYGGVASGSNNYGPSNPALVERVQADIDAFLAEHPSLTVADLPTDLMTASGSGLDPHVSPASAQVQVPQLALNTGLTEDALVAIVADNTEGKVLGIFGEDRVNVLGVNLDIARALGIVANED